MVGFLMIGQKSGKRRTRQQTVPLRCVVSAARRERAEGCRGIWAAQLDPSREGEKAEVVGEEEPVYCLSSSLLAQRQKLRPVGTRQRLPAGPLSRRPNTGCLAIET